MTEHFTRDEAVALAKAAGFDVRRGLGLRESVPEDVFARGLINEEVTALCNAAVTAIDKKREAQGAVGVVNVSNGYKGIPNIAVAWMQEVSHGAKLYTRAQAAPDACVWTPDGWKQAVMRAIRLLVELAAPMLESPELEEAWELHRLITVYLKGNT